MNQDFMLKSFGSLMLAGAVALLSPHSSAEVDKLLALDATGTQVTSDAAGHYVYIPDQKNNRLIIVDSSTLQVEVSIDLPGIPQDVALDEDRQIAYVTLRSFNQVFALDLVTRQWLTPLAVPQAGHEIVVGEDSIFVTTYSSGSGIMQLDRATGEFETSFSEGVFTYAKGAIELTPDKSRLVFANRGLSPGTLAVFDITGDNPVLLQTNDHGALGSNGQDVSVDPVAGNFVSYAVGGGNGAGYTIAKLDINNFSWIGEFATGAYPRAVHHSINGISTYTNNTADEVKVWDNTTLALVDSFTVLGNPKDFADLQNGALLAVLSDEEFALYQTGDFIPEPPAPEFSGSLQGVLATKAVCYNKTTGQKITINLDATQGFDCVAAGLQVQANDRVRVTLHGDVVQP